MAEQFLAAVQACQGAQSEIETDLMRSNPHRVIVKLVGNIDYHMVVSENRGRDGTAQALFKNVARYSPVPVLAVR